jgi:N utilization substance protein A
MAELGEEKIDIIAYDADPATYVANSLKPAQITQVIINKADKSALVIVPENQLSLAIGKSGQNVRLAAKLTGWHLDVKSPEEAEPLLKEWQARMKADEQAMEDEGEEIKKMAGKTRKDAGTKSEIASLPGVGPKLAEKLQRAGFNALVEIASADPEALAAIKGLSAKKAAEIVAKAKKLVG